MEKVVSVALIKGNTVLFQLRDKKEGVIMPGRWGLPGGATEKKETIKQAAIREFKEETGYQLKNPIFFDTHFYEVRGEKVKAFIFYETYDGKQKISCSEGEKMEFKSVKNFKKDEVVPRQDEFAQKAIEIVK